MYQRNNLPQAFSLYVRQAAFIPRILFSLGDPGVKAQWNIQLFVSEEPKES